MSSGKPPEFFLDRSLGRTAAHRLRAAGHVVHLIADFYPRDAQEIGDAEWIAEGCRRGWTLLTKDRRIRYRTDELSALTSGHLFCSAAAFLLDKVDFEDDGTGDAAVRYEHDRAATGPQHTDPALVSQQAQPMSRRRSRRHSARPRPVRRHLACSR